jgi:hypothetical protein
MTTDDDGAAGEPVTGASAAATEPAKNAQAEPAKPAENDDSAAATASADVEKWKSLARKNEDKAKANAAAAKELEALKASQMSETEKAVAEAEQRGRQQATTAAAGKLAAAEVRAALTGVVPDPAAIIEDLDMSRYVTADGDVDEAAVAKLRDKYAVFAANPAVPAVPTGARADDGRGQLTRAQLKDMSPAEIERARTDGLLADVLAGKT